MAHKFISHLALIAVAFCLLGSGAAFKCEKKVLFFETEFDCPRPGQPDNYIFCCGDDDDKHCCTSPLGDIEIDQETLNEIVENVPKILGILFGIIVVLILLCVVCCCCCPFCLCAKNRRAGQVHRGNAEVTVTVPANSQPLQPYPNQPYPNQPHANQPQPGYPAQQPPAPYPAAGYPSAAPAPQPSYPDQPPPYAEKQPAFNPNYAS